MPTVVGLTSLAWPSSLNPTNYMHLVRVVAFPTHSEFPYCQAEELRRSFLLNPVRREHWFSLLGTFVRFPGKSIPVSYPLPCKQAEVAANPCLLLRAAGNEHVAISETVGNGNKMYSTNASFLHHSRLNRQCPSDLVVLSVVSNCRSLIYYRRPWSDICRLLGVWHREMNPTAAECFCAVGILPITRRRVCPRCVTIFRLRVRA